MKRAKRGCLLFTLALSIFILGALIYGLFFMHIDVAKLLN